MDTLSTYMKRFEYGKPYMDKLTSLSIQEIVSGIESIWENSNSNFYDTIQHGDILEKEYKNKNTTVLYDYNLNIEKITVSWDYWDSISIELTAYGLIATYKPEHGPNKEILNLTWAIICNFFNF